MPHNTPIIHVAFATCFFFILNLPQCRKLSFLSERPPLWNTVALMVGFIILNWFFLLVSEKSSANSNTDLAHNGLYVGIIAGTFFLLSTDFTFRCVDRMIDGVVKKNTDNEQMNVPSILGILCHTLIFGYVVLIGFKAVSPDIFCHSKEKNSNANRKEKRNKLAGEHIMEDYKRKSEQIMLEQRDTLPSKLETQVIGAIDDKQLYHDIDTIPSVTDSSYMVPSNMEAQAGQNMASSYQYFNDENDIFNTQEQDEPKNVKVMPGFHDDEEFSSFGNV